MYLQRAVGNSNEDDSNSDDNNNNNDNDNNDDNDDNDDDDDKDVSQHQQRGENKNHAGGKQVGKMQKNYSRPSGREASLSVCVSQISTNESLSVNQTQKANKPQRLGGTGEDSTGFY